MKKKASDYKPKPVTRKTVHPQFGVEWYMPPELLNTVTSPPPPAQ